MIEVEGLRIAYHRAGDGPPLVLLHGYVGDGPTSWRRQIEALADEFTVVAWDAPGAGGSSDPPEGFGMAGYADCLAGFIAGLGLERPHVAGLSFGGALALELCRRHPAVPRTLVLASAYAGWGGSLSAEDTDQRLRQALVLSELSPDEFVDALLPTMFSEGTPSAVVDEFGAAMRSTSSGRVPGHGACGGRGSAGRIAVRRRPDAVGVRQPGRASALTVAEHLHAEISGSTLVVLSGAGHVCNIEAAEEFNRAVRDFLRAHGTRP